MKFFEILTQYDLQLEDADACNIVIREKNKFSNGCKGKISYEYIK